MESERQYLEGVLTLAFIETNHVLEKSFLIGEVGVAFKFGVYFEIVLSLFKSINKFLFFPLSPDEISLIEIFTARFLPAIPHFN